MNRDDLQETINNAWKDVSSINFTTSGAIREAVDEVLGLLDNGQVRVAEKSENGWIVNQWLKKAVLLSFRLNDMKPMDGIASAPYWDKVALKSRNWASEQFINAGFRSVPGSVVRHSAYIAPGTILMPSFVNLGAYVDSGTMIDTWATVGSCAQIGKNCHLSGGVGIGGVLEPLQADPVIIEDNCFIGARSEVAEGVIVETGAVLSMGCYIGQSTKIINRQTGQVHMGRVPAYSVIVPGSQSSDKGGLSLYCCVIVKTVDEQTRAKTSVNDLLRD